ncbi:type VI secretion system baseplate subunit TssF [Geomonas nitrogeniifigens]|uniref:Type VI secretion system baseplate subunit TssF n=1 Tax=Geomonas diazotrophica TaxID=2843197 RepID=A0ABX8JMK0_9BACT|nr:type VI secretion system baseplate subunit TssF [Geomonas nitrogeniifigens]QWV98602.1 type VI secretion system baseplate subunit TssF [Geomonas nitrogeniifigens]
MPDNILNYFERELSYLRDMGSCFARKYPKVAGRLLLEPGKCEDPHTERLIEAFAFLCARIQCKIDDGLPEITQALLQVVYPQLTAPIPSCAVVKFAPLFRNVPQGGYEIAKGTPLFSKPVDGVPCQFRTAYPVVLRPVEVIGASLETPVKLVKGAQQVVRVRLLLHGASGFPCDTLRFYLNGQPQHVFPLYQLLLNHLCRVEHVPAGASVADSLQLSPGCLQPVGYAADEDLLPYPEQSFPGYRLLLEYFAFPHKFLFIDLSGLSVLWKDAALGDAIDLLFYLDTAAPESMAVGAETFCLYATPVVNAFQKIAEPIRHNHGKSEYRIVPDLRREGALEVLSVDEVTATEATSPGEVKQYRPVFSGDGGEDSAGLWQMQRRPASRLHDGGTDVFLSVCELLQTAIVPLEETLLVRVTCSNRNLPVRLPFGDPAGDFDTESTAPLAFINCLLKPTPSLRPFLEGGQQRRLISHLSLNYISLVEGGAGALRQLLSLYDFASSSATRHQISGIVSVRSRTVTRRIGAGFCRGLEVTVVFDEERYVGSGVYLFASILERFLGQYVAVNSFVQLVAVSASNDAVINRWPPRTGDKVLL